MKEIQTDRLCDYGCGHAAKYEMANGKLCCSKSPNSCEANKKKNANGSLKDRVCPHCQQKFKQISGRVFANHVRWCEKNPKHDEICGKGLAKKLAIAAAKQHLEKHGIKKKFYVKCYVCDKEFVVKEYEKDFPIKERYYCSKQCSHYYSAKCVDPQKIRAGVLKYNKEHNRFLHKQIIVKCCWCGKHFETDNVNSAKCCSRSCSSKLKNFRLYQEKLNTAATDAERIKIQLRRYRQQCAFTFVLKEFPNEFDFSLIEKYGWYKAKNHGDNPNGVSRDHMYSVLDGFLNNIDPKLISHPANCRLIQQSQNASKRNKSCITLDQLKERIRIWNEKYSN